MDRFILNDEEKEYLGYTLKYKEGMFFGKNKEHDIGRIFYLDCEMVQTENGLDIVKIAWGNKETNHILLVKPRNRVINYVTEITGVNESTDFEYTFDEAVEIFQQAISPRDILIGHHMYNDLNGLNFFHERIIDTCMIFHHPDGPPTYYSLKYLAENHLQRQIQTDHHDPNEDGMAAYDLVTFCLENGYVKTVWAHINEKFVPSLELILLALKVEKYQVYGIYARGSRAVGTNREDSDYDYVAVCDSSCRIVNGTLIRYGNMDICVYIREQFEQYLRDQIIWVLEAIYCPSNLILLENVNFREYVEEYRKKHKSQCDINLLASVGCEAGRKFSACKKQYIIGNYNQSKKYLFIAIRFIELATQIVTLGRIVDLTLSNHKWLIIKEYPNNLTFNEYKKLWLTMYRKSYRTLSKSTTKVTRSKIISDKNPKMCVRTKLQMNILQQFNDIKGTHIVMINTAIEQLRNYLKLNTIQQLHEEYLISSYRSKEHPQLILFRYDSHKAPESIFRHICRGIILDSEDDWKVISYPFNNFVTDRSSHINPSIIHEKIDGSFCQMYFYEGKWCVSTNRNSDGTSIIGIRRQLRIVFRDLFWNIFQQKYNNIILNTDYTYMFEMISPSHPIIICYDIDDLILIGVRNRVTYQEYSIYESQFNEFDRPAIYSDLNMDSLDINLHEGLVSVTENFDRIKYKTPAYVKKAFKFPLCTNRNSKSIINSIIQVLQSGEKEEFIKYCPEFLPQLSSVEKDYNIFKAKITEIYLDRCKYIENEYNFPTRKDFALSLDCCPRRLHKYLYILFNGYDLELYISSLHPKRLYQDIIFQNTQCHVEDFNNTLIQKSSNKNLYNSASIHLWEEYQRNNASLVICKNPLGFSQIQYIGGLDISFDINDSGRGCSYLTIYDLLNKTIVNESYNIFSTDIPYISGFLGFREVPQYIQLLDSIKTKPFFPQLLMIDGFGILHHRHFGSASQIGLETGIPTIGVAKTLLHIDGLQENTIKQKFKLECNNRGDFIPLICNDGLTYGAAVKTTDTKGTTNPIYVSIGHKISLPTAIDIVLKTCKYRIPEPIRNSDIKSKLHI